MTLYEKLGWDIGINEYLNDVRYTETQLRSANRQWYHFWDLPDRENSAAICYYLLGDSSNCRKYAARMVEHSLGYFYGSWRSEFKTDRGASDPHWWRENASWISPFAEAVCWASCLGDWPAVRRLAEYPSVKCRPDSNRAREDKTLYLALACYIRGERSGDCVDIEDLIGSAKKQKTRLLARIIQALQTKSAYGFQCTVEDYLSYFRKFEFKKTSLDKLLCFDGTTLINIAKCGGMKFKISAGLEEHLIRLVK